MSLHELTAGELITIIKAMLADGAEVMRGEPKLAAWEGDLRQELDALTAAALLSTPTAAPRSFPKGEGLQRDRRVEAALRVLERALENTTSLAIADGDAEAEAAADNLYEAVFDQGLSFTKTSYLNQTGQTTRLLQRARQPEIYSQLAQINVNGRGADALLSLIEANNQALVEYATASSPASPSPSTERNLLQARRDALHTLRLFLAIVERVLPRTEGDDDPRARLTGPLDRALRAATLRANTPRP